VLQASEDVALAYLSTVCASGKLLAPTVSGQASQAPVLQLRVCLQSCLAGPSAATSLQVVSYTEGVRERCHSSWLATFMPAALADGGPEQLPDSAACAACSAAHLQSDWRTCCVWLEHMHVWMCLLMHCIWEVPVSMHC